MKVVNEDITNYLQPKSKEEIKKALNKLNLDDNLFTIGDLKKILEQYPDELPVGCMGHFGEFYNQEKNDIYINYAYVVPEGKSWRNMSNIKIPFLNIISPNIGELPD